MSDPRRTALLSPPELDYLPQIFAPDPARRALSKHLHERGKEHALWDAGEEGATAPETARRVVLAGLARARVVHVPHAALAARKLEEALSREGVVVELALWKSEERESRTGECTLDDADSLEELKRLARERGPDTVRAVLPPRPAAPGRGGGAPWAYRFGLEDERRLAWLERCVREVWPSHVPWWHAVVGFWRQGVSPLEEMYAGNNLADRNAELIENIVP